MAPSATRTAPTPSDRPTPAPAANAMSPQNAADTLVILIAASCTSSARANSSAPRRRAAPNDLSVPIPCRLSTNSADSGR